MSKVTSNQIQATDHLDPEGSIVDSAQRLGDYVSEAVRTAPAVTVSFVGLKGASSSYFNLFLRIVLESLGSVGFQERVVCKFDSALQERVFRRSWDAVSKEAA